MSAARTQYHGWAEVSGHLRRSTFIAMRKAGICDIQIGIESFSPHLLQSFEKGVTAMRNMEMLKWCAELEFNLFYNLLIHYPTETQGDADITLRAIRFARYFQPPSISMFMLTVDSPLERSLRDVDRERRGVGRVETSVPSLLRAVLPEDKIPVLGPLLSPFVGVPPAVERVDWGPVLRAIEAWKAVWERNHRRPALLVRAGPGFAVITDLSGDTARHHRLEGRDAAIYLACIGESRTAEQIAAETRVHPLEVELSLYELEQLGILFSSDGRHLALGVWEDRVAAAALRDGAALAELEPSAVAQAAVFRTADADDEPAAQPSQ
jgi:hypothetical protein